MPTTNRGYATPATGTEVGTWGNVLNANADLIDNNLGGVTTITLSNSSVTLTPDQYKCGTIRLIGTLSADVTVFLPAVSGWWVIDNRLRNNTRFVHISCIGGVEKVAPPPGVLTDICTDGTNVRFRNLGKVGEYWFYSGTTVPAWVSNCTIPPYLNCIGGTFSSSTYPILAEILGSTALPDFKGRGFYALNQGSNRITTAGSGINGDVLFSAGGTQSTALVTANLPSMTPTGTVNSVFSGSGSFDGSFNGPAASGSSFAAMWNQTGVQSVNVTGTVTSTFTGNALGGNSTSFSLMNPGVIGGLVLIRAA